MCGERTGASQFCKKDFFIVRASPIAYCTRERGRSHYKCKTEMLPRGLFVVTTNLMIVISCPLNCPQANFIAWWGRVYRYCRCQGKIVCKTRPYRNCGYFSGHDRHYSGSQKSEDSPMPYALCPMPYALCPMPYALCPMPDSTSSF